MDEFSLPEVREQEKEQICGQCPWGTEPDPLVMFLNEKLAMKDAGCPLERHELTNPEWLAFGAIQAERVKLQAEEAKRRQKENNG